MSSIRFLILIAFSFTLHNFTTILSATLLTDHSWSSAPKPLLSFLYSLPSHSQLLLLQWSNHSALHHCKWQGISCSSNLNIYSINLTGIGIAGSFFDAVPHLCGLQALTTLDLSKNLFYGPIPSQLGNCSALRSLILNNNLLNGSIPAQLFNISGQLVELDLGYNALSGTIPKAVGFATLLEYLGLYANSFSGSIPRELLFLPRLRFLYVNENNFTGKLPDFPNFCALSELYVHQNQLTGRLPQSLFNCHSLTIFSASYNQLEGLLPDDFDQVPRLQILYLEENRFIGELPKSLQSLLDLVELLVSKNGFSGSIPEGIGWCRSLQTLSAIGNQLSGSIPSSIGNLSTLQYLRLSQNQLVGPLPRELGRCSLMLKLELSENLIGGHIPPEIGELRYLENLYLFENMLEGRIPAEIGKMRNLMSLQLYNNSLSGEIPREITLLKRLNYISLASNHLSGEVPSTLGRNMYGAGLIKVDLTNNNFHGPIPSDLCSSGNLTVLVIGQNHFNGTFPVEISRCKSLRRVILAKNQLQGSIPSNLDIKSAISYLDLSNNLFEGNIPLSIASWCNLSMLDLSNNSLTGAIPPEFGALANLVKLNLASNRLTGIIPPVLGNCKKLLQLDLRENKLAGSIPKEVVALAKLQNLVLSDNMLSGSIPDMFTTLQDLYELQLGGNNLNGFIPYSLGNLQFLHLVLNLSNNRLTGKIPSSFGNLDKLQVLDLSNNFLSGEIPEALNKMLSLSFVNVSFNQFSGLLPTNWMAFVASKPGSFQGNPLLCLRVENCNVEQGMNRKHSRTKRIILATVSSSVLFLLAGLYAAKYAKTRVCQLSSKYVSARSISSTEELPEDLTYEDIIRATEDLSDKYVIGRGRHGTVYKMEIGINKRWAIKKLDLCESSFYLEVRILSYAKHRNLVKMSGYCIRDGLGMIVYEYMSGGTLFEVLHQRKPEIALDWRTRHCIALGLAQGLSYLHYDCMPQIIHRDVKSNNILLDSDLEPKIGDFGMAKMVDGLDERTTLSAIVGTLGYIAPENGYSIKLTEKSDVYSYGVVLLELLCRKLPVDSSFDTGVDIVHWIRSNMAQNDIRSLIFCLDEEIIYWKESERTEALKLLELAISCTEQACNARPSMREVVKNLLKMNSKV